LFGIFFNFLLKLKEMLLRRRFSHASMEIAQLLSCAVEMLWSDRPLS